MRTRSSVIVIVVGLLAVTIAGVVSMYPSLSDARDAVERQWARLEPTLDARYEALASLSRAVRAVNADLELLDEVDDAIGDWKALTSKRPTPDASDEPAAANRVEGEAARLARTVTTRPSLRDNADVVATLSAYLATDPTASTQPFNDTVRRYDKARNRFPGPFFASMLGFDTMDTVEVPGALADLDVPEVPVAPEPEAEPEPDGDAPAEAPEPASP